MANNDKTIFNQYLTGGDLVFNRLQYFFANVVRTSVIGFVIFSFSSWTLIRIFLGKYEWYVFTKSLYTHFWTLIHFPNYPIDYVRPDGEMVSNVASAAVLKFIQETPELSAYVDHAYWMLTLALFITAGAIAFYVLFLIRYGKKSLENDFIRGQKIVTADELKAKVKSAESTKLNGEPSPIKIAGVPIPRNLLPRNILAVGSMGTGKSQLIEQIIEDARAWGKKLVIYDKTGEFTSRWYRPGKDVILSPVDARCADWSIFADMREITDPAMISLFFVPAKKGGGENDMWDSAARMLLEDLFVIVRKQGGTMADVKNIITQYTLEELSQLLKAHNAPSCGTINPKNERGSESVRLTLVSQPAIRFFEFFDNKNAKFSIRDFIRREDDACLFLVSNSTKHETAKPFISAWLEIALAEVMDMPPVQETRMFLILDELASLPRIKALDIAFSEARKFGVCSVVGIQNLAQSDETNGENVTKTYVANLQNKAIFRTEEEASAKRLADTLAKEDVVEKNKALSFGVELSRDGVNLSDKRGEINLVTYSEIMTLPDLTGYLKIAGDYPIAKIKLEYKGRKAISDAYQKRAGLDLVDAPQQAEAAAVVNTEPSLESAAASVATEDYDDLPIAAPATAAANAQEDDWNPDI
jgi:type IV conjugative transfer system coupling protein TraD